tara:strand:+ start:101 stop:490 length:390 start_codon:yes stop_codon:yes gene_type:complete
MKSTTKRTQRDYSLAFKLSVVDQVEKGEFTYKQAQDYYGIQGRSTVLIWLRKHGRLDWSKGTPQCSIRTKAMTDPKQLTPEQKIKALEQELEDTKLKAQFFEAIVDVLDKDFGVRITKKQRAKLLNKKT